MRGFAETTHAAKSSWTRERRVAARMLNRAARRAVWEGRVPSLPPIQIPTRVYWGDRDPVLKAGWMDRLPETFTNLRASVAEGVGHFVHYEAPERAAREIAEFFEALAT